MDMSVATNAIIEEFTRKYPASLKLYREALGVFPSGVTHDNRYFKPFSMYMSRCFGAHKVDLDGNEFIDYWMGHGALLLGHNPPQIVQAVVDQMSKGTHYGASNELEIRWGKLVQRLVPSAEKVQFVSSGTEADMMAIRLARAFTGRNKLIRFEGHFHGWSEAVMFGHKEPYNLPSSAGIPVDLGKYVTCLPSNDVGAVAKALTDDPDVACVILEPAGASNATVPTRKGFLQELRNLCSAHGVILIFDEVITGFRHAPGGAQEYFGVKPDITALGKILAGGLPGGAVAGRADILDLIAFKDEPEADRHRQVVHPGTFNANPLSAAAGVAMLQIASTGEPQKRAVQLQRQLLLGLNDVLRSRHILGCVYGDPGGFHLFVGQPGCDADDAEDILAVVEPSRLLRGMGPLAVPMRAALLLEGVDHYGMGRLSSAHTDADVQTTVGAFDRAVSRLKGWGLL